MRYSDFIRKVENLPENFERLKWTMYDTVRGERRPLTTDLDRCHYLRVLKLYLHNEEDINSIYGIHTDQYYFDKHTGMYSPKLNRFFDPKEFVTFFKVTLKTYPINTREEGERIRIEEVYEEEEEYDSDEFSEVSYNPAIETPRPTPLYSYPTVSPGIIYNTNAIYDIHNVPETVPEPVPEPPQEVRRSSVDIMQDYIRGLRSGQTNPRSRS